MGFPSEYKRNFGYKFSHFGSNTNGHDLKAFGDTTGKYFMWDASADTLIAVGDFTFTGGLTLTGALAVTGTADLGTSCEADAYTVGGVAGADHGPADITSLTVVKGIVTAVTSA